MAEKLPSGSYRTRVTYTDDLGTRQSISFTARTPDEADFKALEYKLKRKRESKPSNMTTGAAVDKFIEANEAILSPSTIRGYKKEKRCHMEAIQDVLLKNLSQDNVQRWVNSLVKKKLAPKTVFNAYGVLKSVLSTYAPDLTLRI
ncbi:MAG: site-specific integrase, partial [Clostridia bacterium]